MPPRAAKRPRRKAKQARARETVEALLEAAARVLEERGYAGATTNRIAEVAGVSVGTLYEYFANKEAVYDALIQEVLETLVLAIRSQDLDPKAPLREALGGLVGPAMAAMRHGPGFMRSLEQVPGAVFRRRLAAARQSITGFVRQVLAAHEAELRTDDLDLAAFMVVSAAQGIGANASDELFDERLADEVVTLLTLYLTGGSPHPA